MPSSELEIKPLLSPAFRKAFLPLKPRLISLFGWLVLFQCLTVQTVAFAQAVQLEKSFRAENGQHLELDLEANAQVSLMGWDKEEIVVKVHMEGQYFQVDCRQEEGVTRLISRYETANDRAFSQGTIQVFVPYSLPVQAKVQRGDVSLRELKGSTTVDAGTGMVTGYQLQGQAVLNSQGGNVQLYGGRIVGGLSTQQGKIELSDLRGEFSALADKGFFSVRSLAEPVEGTIEAGLTRLQVKNADLDARVYESALEVTWSGDLTDPSHSLQLSGENSAITLALPESTGLDTFLEQISTDPATQTSTTLASARTTTDPAKKRKKSALESDFALGTLPAAKKLKHQGKDLQLVQLRQKLNGGKNQLEIRAVDSQVMLKKIKPQ